MNELLERYLDAVAVNLPRGQQDDIVAELRDLLLTKIEENEEALGRPLTGAEAQALLAEFGHPLQVAGRYGRNQHLVGPTVYPFYVYALKVVLGIVAVVNLAGWLIAMAVGHGGAPFGQMVPALLIAFAAVTITAALIERYGKADRYLRPWKPGPLPKHGRLRDRRLGRRPCDLFLEICFGVAALLWWVGVTDFGLSANYGIRVEFAAIWHELYWPILGLIVVQIAMDAYALAVPSQYRIHAALRIVRQLCLLPVLWILSQGGHWFDLTLPGPPQAAATMEAHIDQWFPVGIAVTLVIMLVEVARAAWVLLQGRKPAAA